MIADGDNTSLWKLWRNRPRRDLFLTGLAVASLGAIAFCAWLDLDKLPDIKVLETYHPVEAIRIFDQDDKLAAVISGEEDRRIVTLNQISPNMRKATIAAEDHEFYRHAGVNPSSIMRALIVNMQAGHVVEGGSTITQQLVKNVFFPGQGRSVKRKLKEFILATQIDYRYSKDKILEMYLNQIYFGNQSYGIESAAERYFNKPASKLTLAESAFLAGLVRSPSYLAYGHNRTLARTRQRSVLDKMVEYGMISKAEANSAYDQKLAFRHFVNPYQKYPFYVSYVMDELRDHFSERELQSGLKVYTYLDPKAQTHGEAIINEGIAHAPAGVTQGALVSLHVNDGGVFAVVGGAGKYEDHQWNRAVSPHTMGSAFKPFVYLAGFLKGVTPESIVLDSPFSAPSGGRIYSPRNFDNGFRGAMTIRKALQFSRNVCAVRMAAFVGIQNVIDTAHKAGITFKLDPYLPTAVGSGAASPLEMAGGYSTFARAGIYITPHLVRSIQNNAGKTIYVFDQKPQKMFDSAACSSLVDVMITVVKAGTATRAQLSDRVVAGKTGTADQSKDVWFVGFTPDTCTALWGGNDHNKAINNRGVTGGMVMAGMFKKFMTEYYKEHPTPAGTFMTAGSNALPIAMTMKDLSIASSKGITLVDGYVIDERLAAQPPKDEKKDKDEQKDEDIVEPRRHREPSYTAESVPDSDIFDEKHTSAPEKEPPKEGAAGKEEKKADSHPSAVSGETNGPELPMERNDIQVDPGAGYGAQPVQIIPDGLAPYVDMMPQYPIYGPMYDD